MIEIKPLAVFGDFNNYPGDKSFEKLKSIYRDANTDDAAYSHINSSSDKKFLLDHVFTISDNVSMEYINTLDNGFDHNGMLITIE
jgi:endonuclease/exonuclease/phosphatase family metal-dependent hydrolase